jgi:hypothetical protein
MTAMFFICQSKTSARLSRNSFSSACSTPSLRAATSSSTASAVVPLVIAA